MKKFFASLIVGLVSFTGFVNAAETCCQAPAPVPGAKSVLGICNHLGVGLGVGTNGISVEAATPLTRFVSVRAGVHFMPNIKYSTDVDATYYVNDQEHYTDVDVDCGIGRTQGSLIFNIYPLPYGERRKRLETGAFHHQYGV